MIELVEKPMVLFDMKDMLSFEFYDPQRMLNRLNIILKQKQCDNHNLIYKKICDIKQAEWKAKEWAYACTKCDALFIKQVQF